MKRIGIYTISALVTLSATTSCSYREYSAIATGSSLGAIFGSSLGGLMGGPRGSDKGTLAGMVIGAAAGAAVVGQQQKQRTATPQTDDSGDGYDLRGGDVQYGSYNSPTYRERTSAHTDLEYLEVANVKFLDSNNNECLDADESAFIVMDIYNRADHEVYNVTPIITCANSRVLISPATTVSHIASGRGVRYKAALRAPRRLPDGQLAFKVSFGSGKARITAREFTINTRR